MNKLLVLGAYSAIAKSCCRIWATRGAELTVVGRSKDQLEALAEDLKARGASKVHLLIQDLTDRSKHQALIDDAAQRMGRLDLIFVAYGVLGNDQKAQQDPDYAMKLFDVNFLSAVSLLTIGSAYMEQQGQGYLAAISSVAGDRGRQSNYVYGSAKGALALYLQGLRNRLSRQGVHVLTIKPGFVDSPMTNEFDKGPLWAAPETVGRDIVKALDRRRDVLYTPFFWRFIMMVIKFIPERIFKKLRL